MSVMRFAAGAALASAFMVSVPVLASAQPIFTPEPGGVIKVESAPGEWWKCGLYSTDAPNVRGLPPVVNYPPGSYSQPNGELPAANDDPAVVNPNFGTGAAYAKFAPGSTVVADCVSQYLPVFWLQVIRAGE
ncbi:hypothetical protein GFY24_29620 [Nocardia sp. SYP-A9097]|uniref:hypothetical protein n=1 Tax=Nocardia sp. SYP-A9097 TaxID=2663237 RepID=UPI00129BE13A|nr:hypothetical protein [Nocardia sp. SYP-A9097]MRH91551.1 hypothetical protein [Nocardia sp. SYP-A9097]